MTLLLLKFKDLQKKLIKKFTIVVNDRMIGINIKALIGLNRDPKLSEIVYTELLKIQEVGIVSEVTGRFDMLITVGTRTLEELHSLVIERIGKIDGIQNTETFVEMQRIENEPQYIL